MGNEHSMGTSQIAKVKKVCSSWMKDIPDDTYISELSIPGTHDSGADCARYKGADYARC